MTCARILPWLDEGRPSAGAAEARAHAAGCAACARALALDEAMETLLRADEAPAPARFTHQVLDRLTLPVPSLSPVVPWWMRAALDPAAILAGLLAGVLTWGWSAFAALAVATGDALARWGVAAGSGSTASLPQAVVAGLGTTERLLLLEVVALFMILAAPGIYGFAVRLTSRVALGRPRRPSLLMPRRPAGAGAR